VGRILAGSQAGTCYTYALVMLGRHSFRLAARSTGAETVLLTTLTSLSLFAMLAHAGGTDTHLKSVH
jgi:hypothetical protein